jgi:hypothetical protein
MMPISVPSSERVEDETKKHAKMANMTIRKIGRCVGSEDSRDGTQLPKIPHH